LFSYFYPATRVDSTSIHIRVLKAINLASLQAVPSYFIAGSLQEIGSQSGDKEGFN
jgi:hypothetical protein